MLTEKGRRKWIEDTVDGLAECDSFRVETGTCPHCRRNIRYPVIAREEDVQLLDMIIASAQEAMSEYGITGNLLAEIRAKCYLEIARKGK